MNFRVFGGGLFVVGLILTLVGYPQAFPKKEEYVPGTVTQGMLDSADCFFHGNNCDAESIQPDTPQVGLFYSGLAILVLGLLIFISSRKVSNEKQ